MSVLGIEAVRQRIATQVATLSGWHVSGWPAELFGRDSSNLAHLSFAIEVGRGEPANGLLMETARATRGTLGGEWHHELRVRWAHRLRSDARVADYDAALALHDDLRVAILGTAQTSGLRLLVLGEERQVIAEGPWYVGTTTIRATFNVSIQ